MDLLLQHFGHEHPLKFVQDHIPPSEEQKEEEEEETLCDCCQNRVEGPSYCCSELCKFYLHKRCAELELAPQIYHPLHLEHPLNLLVKSPYPFGYGCDFCGGGFSKFVYHCAYCSFDLDLKCALPHTFCHENQIEKEEENQMEEVETREKPLFGPIYERGKLPLQINHPYDRSHPLSLLPYPTAHQENCSCYLCTIEWKGFVYCCSLCNIELTPEDVSAPRTITSVSHDHPWTLVSSPISFICDYCGDDGVRTPYICTTCDLIVHKNCTSLPRTIRIARHPHPISHVYSLQQNQLEELICRICHQKVNVRCGSYCCSAFDCNYIAHVNCASVKDVWDGTVGLDDEDENEKSKGVVYSGNMITDVISEETVGEDVMATEIKHAYHEHNLILNFRGEIKDDKICDGCMRPISSTHFYSCQQCRFFLHKSCAELPREKGLAIHKHLLKLTNNGGSFGCCACRRDHNGFSYKCDQLECDDFEIDIQCSLQPDTLMHPSHEHSLFLSHNYKGPCSGCCRMSWSSPVYRCTKRCDFTLGFCCLKLPLRAGYKYDKHPLTLTYYNYSDLTQFYCDVCEEERDSKEWFYYCARCDNSVHKECALGHVPFIKLGSTYGDHEDGHSLTLVDNIWDCPRCNECGKLCYRQVLQCKESGCDYTTHWYCRNRWP